MAWLLDLDGVVWLAGVPIPGAPEAVARLRAAGERVAFVTNFSVARVSDHEASLAAIGIPAEGDVIGSSRAAASLVGPDDDVLVVGGPGIREEVTRRGARLVDDGPVTAVVVGLTFDFDYALLAKAATAVRNGARFIGSNDDATYPTAEGLLPGAGALLAAVARAAGVVPTVAGKPNQPMADAVLAAVGPGPHTMVGDRDDTDGLFARRMGARFALVLSGVTRPGDLPVDPAPDVVAPDLAALVARELGQT
jgi:HAD superfamily hydrolase (TIGR01450 family)